MKIPCTKQYFRYTFGHILDINIWVIIFMPYSVILKISVMIKTGSGFQIELHFIATDEQFWSHLHFRMNRCSEDDTNFLLKWNIAMVWSSLKTQENYILIYLSFPYYFFFPFFHQSFTLENWFLPPTPSFLLSFCPPSFLEDWFTCPASSGMLFELFF